MRKITKETARSLLDCKPCKISNTCVEAGIGDSWDLFLHFNLIASYNPTKKELMIRDAGWQSNTTKERLNGILTTFGITDGIYQKNRTWYTNEGKRNGTKTYKI